MRPMTEAAAPGSRIPPPPPEPDRRPNGVRVLCVPLCLDADLAREFDRLLVHTRHLLRKEPLYRAGEPFTTLHAVRRGAIKTLLLAEDGREQITGYHMPGDIVGLDGLGQPLHACDAIALEASEVCSLPFGRLDEITCEPRLAQCLFQLMARDLRRNRDQIRLLGSMSAQERLATFLLNLEERHGTGSELALKMTREEIASFLGLKLETVSRIFSRLRGEGLIEVQGRAVRLVDAAGLRRVAGPGG